MPDSDIIEYEIRGSIMITSIPNDAASPPTIFCDISGTPQISDGSNSVFTMGVSEVTFELQQTIGLLPAVPHTERRKNSSALGYLRLFCRSQSNWLQSRMLIHLPVLLSGVTHFDEAKQISELKICKHSYRPFSQANHPLDNIFTCKL